MTQKRPATSGFVAPPPGRKRLDTPEADAFITGGVAAAPVGGEAPSQTGAQGGSSAIPPELIRPQSNFPWEALVPNKETGLLTRMPADDYGMLKWLARSVYNRSLQELAMVVFRNFTEGALREQGYQVSRGKDGELIVKK